MLTTNQIILLLRIYEDKSIINIDKTTQNIKDLMRLYEKLLITIDFTPTNRGIDTCHNIEEHIKW